MSDLRTEIFTKVLPKMQSLTNLSFDDPEQVVVETPSVSPEESLGKVTNNELIFNWVKLHPACTAKEVSLQFAHMIDQNSVYSQLHGMAARKLLHKTTCSSTGKLIYSAAVDAYPRTTRLGQIAKMNAAREAIGQEEMGRRIREGHKANKLVEADKQLEPVREVAEKKRKAIPTSTAYAPAAVQVTPVDLNTLSIVQARKLYDELKQIFGA